MLSVHLHQAIDDANHSKDIQPRLESYLNVSSRHQAQDEEIIHAHLYNFYGLIALYTYLLMSQVYSIQAYAYSWTKGLVKVSYFLYNWAPWRGRILWQMRL